MDNVNIFFAADRTYLPYLGVSIYSISEHAVTDREYNLTVLTTDMTDDSLAVLNKFTKPNIKIHIRNVESEISYLRKHIAPTLRDYYSEAIFYRILIPGLFPDIEKAVYLDSDTVACRDVADLYDTELDGYLLAAVTDETVIGESVFCKYVENYVGIDDAEEYFNSGVLVMNLSAMRRERTCEKLIDMMENFSFKTVAPDQDYLNFLCQGRVKYLHPLWNKHPILYENEQTDEDVFIMHYNMFYKPWHYFGVVNERLFWKTAACTPFITELLRERNEYTDEQRASDLGSAAELLHCAEELAGSHEGFASLLCT